MFKMEIVLNARRLLRFLKEKYIYAQFRRNFFNQSDVRTEWVRCNFFAAYSEYKCNDSLSKYANSILSTKDLINYAFRWSDTKEGYDFWEKINAEWRRYIKEKKT